MARSPSTPLPRRHRGPLILLAAALAGAALGGGALLLAERLRGPVPSRPARAVAPAPEVAPASAAAPAPSPPDGQQGAATDAAPIRWRCPMHPGVVRDHPGECPLCGMTLVKDEGGGAGPDRPGSAGGGPDHR